MSHSPAADSTIPWATPGSAASCLAAAAGIMIVATKASETIELR